MANVDSKQTASSAPTHRYKKFLLYGTSRSIAQGLLSLRGIALASLLGPEGYGVWALMRIAMDYGRLTSFGIFRGLEFEVAQARPLPPGSYGKAELACRTTLGFILSSRSLLAIIAFGISFAITKSWLALGMRVFAVAIVTRGVWIYVMTCLLSSGQLRRFGITELALALIHLICAASGAAVWGLSGAFGGYLLASLFSVALIAPNAPMRPAYSIPTLRRLLKVGMPLALSAMFTVALAGIDRLVVGAYAGLEALGYYALGVAISGLTASLAIVVRTVVMPDVYKGAQQDGSVSAVRKHLVKTILPFARFFPILVGALALLVGPSVKLFLPSYLPAVPAARIIIFTGITVGLATLGALGVIAAGQQRLLPLLSGGLLVVNGLLAYSALRFGLGILGVAWGTLFSRSLYGMMLLWLTARAAAVEKTAGVVWQALLPLVWCIALVTALGVWFPGEDLIPTAQAIGLYSLGVLPFVPALVRQLKSHRASLPPESITRS